MQKFFSKYFYPKSICIIRAWSKPKSLGYKLAKSVAQMMVDNPDITECDLNPFLIDEKDEVFAVDVRVKL